MQTHSKRGELEAVICNWKICFLLWYSLWGFLIRMNVSCTNQGCCIFSGQLLWVCTMTIHLGLPGKVAKWRKMAETSWCSRRPVLFTASPPFFPLSFHSFSTFYPSFFFTKHRTGWFIPLEWMYCSISVFQLDLLYQWASFIIGIYWDIK